MNLKMNKINYEEQSGERDLKSRRLSNGLPELVKYTIKLECWASLASMGVTVNVFVALGSETANRLECLT